jgi:hypothetical protein
VPLWRRICGKASRKGDASMAEHYRDLIRTLMRNGFSFKRQGAGSDEIWWNRSSGGEVTLDRNIGSRAAATAVLVDAGIEKAEKPSEKAAVKPAAKASAKPSAKSGAKAPVKNRAKVPAKKAAAVKAAPKKKSAAKMPAKAKAKNAKSKARQAK